MVPDNYLDLIYEDGMSAQEYFDLGKSLQETDPEASDKAFQTYNGLKHEYFNDLLNSLNFHGELKPYGLLSEDFFFFYTYMTKEEILNLTCDEDESYYITAMGRYK